VPGAVLPSLRRRPPRVCVVVDTSGSVSDAELGSALLEVAAISQAVGGRRDLVSVVPCDAAARIVHPLSGGRGSPWSAAAGRTCGRASRQHCGPCPGRTWSWS
jgi:predicted metal-dependent peptidase